MVGLETAGTGTRHARHLGLRIHRAFPRADVLTIDALEAHLGFVSRRGVEIAEVAPKNALAILVRVARLLVAGKAVLLRVAAKTLDDRRIERMARSRDEALDLKRLLDERNVVALANRVVELSVAIRIEIAETAIRSRLDLTVAHLGENQLVLDKRSTALNLTLLARTNSRAAHRVPLRRLDEHVATSDIARVASITLGADLALVAHRAARAARAIRAIGSRRTRRTLGRVNGSRAANHHGKRRETTTKHLLVHHVYSPLENYVVATTIEGIIAHETY